MYLNKCDIKIWMKIIANKHQKLCKDVFDMKVPQVEVIVPTSMGPSTFGLFNFWVEKNFLNIVLEW